MLNAEGLLSRVASRMHKGGFRVVDILVWLLLAGFAAFIIHELSLGLTVEKIILTSVLSYYLLVIAYEYSFNRAHVPTVNTDAPLIACMTNLILKEVQQNRERPFTIVDCGSGTGALTRAFARACVKPEYGEVKIIGFERLWFPCAQSIVLATLMGLGKKIEYVHDDMFAHDFTNTQVVTMFLNARVAEQLGNKLYAELPPGALVISNEFEMKGSWPEPERVNPPQAFFKGKLFVYRR